MSTTEWTEESTSRFAQLGDMRLHYNDVGEGPPLVMLHGAGPGASSWSNFRGNLPALGAHFRVLLVDQPGFGKSEQPAIKGSFYAHYAEAVRQLLDDLNIERASFVGNSLGGGTTLHFALEWPERADRLVLMAPAGGSQPILTPGEVGPRVGALLAQFAESPTEQMLERFIREMVYDFSIVTPDLFAERFRTAASPEVLASIRAFVATGMQMTPDERRSMELWHRVDEIEHPTLLVWGRDDRILPLDSALLMLRRMRDVRLHVFARCGHWAQVERREEFDRLVVDFLTSS